MVRKCGWMGLGGCLLAWAGPALAGTGPWTLEQDDLAVFTSVDYQRWRALKPAGELLDPVSTSALRGSLTYGLLWGAEVQVQWGYAWSSTGRPDEGVCASLGAGACDPVNGLTPLDARVKFRVLDELAGRPVSLALGAGIRTAEWAKANRHRITSFTEGQTDLYGLVSVGRTGGVGAWSYAAALDLGYYHRQPVALLEGRRAPGDDVVGSFEMLLYPSTQVGFGPAVDGLHRLTGTDLPLTDEERATADRFTGLSVTSVKAGAKVLVRSSRNVTFTASAFRTVYARNNPSDALTVSLGLGVFIPNKSAEAP